LFVVRAALGIGMGAEWPAGASLAMESWPARSRGLMGSALQGAFPLGFALASLAYGLLFDAIGWRGLLWLGILRAILCVFIRYYVKEPAVWLENRKRQREQKQEVRAPLLVIFKPALLTNTLRQVRLNGSYLAQVTPSWYGDSVGHYDGDVLVVDTVGIRSLRPFAMVDVYGTPYTDSLHVVERYRLIDREAAIEAHGSRIAMRGPGVMFGPRS
jgi:MFS family permease